MRCRTLGFLVTLALSLFATALAVEAQQATKVHRLGYLSHGFPLPEFAPHVEAFREGLRALGYVEGQNLVIEYRYAEGSDERLRDLAAELVRLQVEVIVVGGAPGSARPSTPRARSRSSWRAPQMRWPKGSSPAWRARGGTSRA